MRRRRRLHPRVRCAHCNERRRCAHSVWRVCYDCLQDHFVYCRICRSWLHEDEAEYRHRHVFYHEGAWLGPGGRDMSPEHEAEIRASFWVVLDKTALAPQLAATIRAGQIALRFYGSLFGAEGVWCPVVGEDGRYAGDYGQRFTNALHYKDGPAMDRRSSHDPADWLSEEEARALEERMSLGVNWLVALYHDSCPDANALTLRWIGEWEQGGAGQAA